MNSVRSDEDKIEALEDEVIRLQSILDNLKADMHAHTTITSVLQIVDNAHYKAFHS